MSRISSLTRIIKRLKKDAIKRINGLGSSSAWGRVSLKSRANEKRHTRIWVLIKRKTKIGKLIKIDAIK